MTTKKPTLHKVERMYCVSCQSDDVSFLGVEDKGHWSFPKISDQNKPIKPTLPRVEWTKGITEYEFIRRSELENYDGRQQQAILRFMDQQHDERYGKLRIPNKIKPLSFIDRLKRMFKQLLSTGI